MSQGIKHLLPMHEPKSNPQNPQKARYNSMHQHFLLGDTGKNRQLTTQLAWQMMHLKQETLTQTMTEVVPDFCMYITAHTAPFTHTCISYTLKKKILTNLN